LVAGSIPAPGTISVHTVYILRGKSGRHYIGVTNDFAVRFLQHQNGHTHTTRRLGGELQLVVKRDYATRPDALDVERRLKSWKNPTKAIVFLSTE
jgi:putative endonuclease